MADTMQLSEGQILMGLMVKELKRRLEEDAVNLKAADFEMIRKLLADGAITLASVQRGDFGELAQSVAQQYPFSGDEEAPVFN